MTNLLDIIHRLFLIKVHNLSETGVCLCYQVKDTYSVGPDRSSPYLRMTETDSNLQNVVCFNQKYTMDNVQEVYHFNFLLC
jgi:hypothetical protein